LKLNKASKYSRSGFYSGTAFFILLWQMASINLNGKIYRAEEPVLFASNRSYRYGDGLFETMKVKNGELQLAGLHFERLFYCLRLLNYEVPVLFTPETITQQVIQLCTSNKCEKLARVRLSVFRGNGGLYDDDKKLNYLVECWPLSESVNRLNENGLVIDIYPDAAKSVDSFSNLKSANFLPYSLAAVYAKEKKLNDCLVLNCYGRIADSTIANIFLVTNNSIITPALSEGCVAGVMRKHLLGTLAGTGYSVMEQEVTAEQVEKADEVFLTNAINGIRWVKNFRNKEYSRTKTTEIYHQLFQTRTV
jgi:branched-chain amino acid aminotransferase